VTSASALLLPFLYSVAWFSPSRHQFFIDCTDVECFRKARTLLVLSLAIWRECEGKQLFLPPKKLVLLVDPFQGILSSHERTRRTVQCFSHTAAFLPISLMDEASAPG